MIAYLNNNKIRNIHILGGGTVDGVVTNWSDIGYTIIPKIIEDAYKYSKDIYDNWDASITNRAGAFGNDSRLVYFPAVDTSNVTNMQDMLANSNLQIVPFFDTSNVTNMQHTFGNTQVIEMDLRGWNTSKVTSLYATFRNCGELRTLDIRGLDLSNVTKLQEFASGCGKLTNLYCDPLNMPNLQNMSYAFQNCVGFSTLELTGWNVPQVTSMEYMFGGCSGLTSLDLRNWNTSSLQKIGQCFANCKSLQSINISGWDTSNVTDWQISLNSFLEGCSALTKVDGYFDYTSTVKNGYSETYTFRRCSQLRKFEVRNVGKHPNAVSCWFNGNYDGMKMWGENSDDIPDARESMINTLITYSFDRASAGYSNCTITLHANAKARLTDDEIAQITAKGYTIA